MRKLSRHLARIPVAGLIALGGGTAFADVVTPPEGGVWKHGRDYSNYLHESKSHGSSVQGKKLCSLTLRRLGPMVICTYSTLLHRQPSLVQDLLINRSWSQCDQHAP
ncbi:lactococcin 972 family bacteriocin [Austwickia chelonae]|uniref:lactococcin 972 family bacteriocin n=1 Tax=Austwickia chelonae TaxID=100225 RepID=UPI003D318D6E